MRDNIARVRELLSQAKQPVSKPRSAAEAESKKAFEWFNLNGENMSAVSQSPRSRMEREVARIAQWYNWPGEVVRALDREAACCLEDLSDAGLHSLLERLHRLEQCFQEGLDPPDSAPAR